MQIIENITDLNKAIKNFNNIGFVPTMGGIHKGHLALIKNSQNKCQKTYLLKIDLFISSYLTMPLTFVLSYFPTYRTFFSICLSG